MWRTHFVNLLIRPWGVLCGATSKVRNPEHIGTKKDAVLLPIFHSLLFPFLIPSYYVLIQEIKDRKVKIFEVLSLENCKWRFGQKNEL